ncbi:TPA: tetratricopeptide repeat protein [Enterobacter hormaechei]
MVELKRLVVCTIFILCGCSGTLSSNFSDDQQKEFILNKVNNNKGLIEFYREKLRKHDDADIRYKLSERYYIIEDYDSSLRYLKPMLIKGDEKVLLLASRDYLETGDVERALNYVKQIIDINPKNGEAYNLQGVILAQKGDYNNAYVAYDKARQLFVDEKLVGNNIAMTNILQGDYASARDTLLGLYRSGNSDSQVLHNLVYVLIKLNDINSAEAILHEISPDETAADLIESLGNIEPVKNKIKASSIATINDHKEVNKTRLKPADKSDVLLPKVSLLSSTSQPSNTYNMHHDQLLKKVSLDNLQSYGSIIAFTLSSRYELNYAVLPSQDKNSLKIELFNCQPDRRMNENIASIASLKGVSHAEAKIDDKGNTIITVLFGDAIIDHHIQRNKSSDYGMHGLNVVIAHHV